MICPALATDSLSMYCDPAGLAHLLHAVWCGHDEAICEVLAALEAHEAHPIPHIDAGDEEGLQDMSQSSGNPNHFNYSLSSKGLSPRAVPLNMATGTNLLENLDFRQVEDELRVLVVIDADGTKFHGIHRLGGCSHNVPSSRSHGMTAA